MSYDIHFVAGSMRGHWDEAMQRIEAATVAGTAKWTDDLVAEWDVIVESAQRALPSLDSNGRRLMHPRSSVELVGHPEQITMTVSLSSGPVKEVVTALTEMARAVESCTGLVAYDNQTGSGLLEEGNPSEARWMASASRLSLETLLMPDDSVGGTSGMFALLTKEELKALRAVKGDRGRRTHVDALLPQLPSDRLRVIGQEWRYINRLGRAHIPELEIFVGQRMHRGNGQEITLVKDPVAQAEVLARTPSEEVKALVSGLSDSELWWGLSFLGQGTARMSEAIASASAAAWTDIEATLAHAIEHDLAVLFVVDHYARKTRGSSVEWIDEEPK